jgi:hypothetical protein
MAMLRDRNSYSICHNGSEETNAACVEIMTVLPPSLAKSNAELPEVTLCGLLDIFFDEPAVLFFVLCLDFSKVKTIPM